MSDGPWTTREELEAALKTPRTDTPSSRVFLAYELAEALAEEGRNRVLQLGKELVEAWWTGEHIFVRPSAKGGKELEDLLTPGMPPDAIARDGGRQ